MQPETFHAIACHSDANYLRLLTVLERIEKRTIAIMATLADVNSAQQTLHGDLVAQNGLIKQILTAVANGSLTSAAAQALVDGMNADDQDAKANIAAITAALPPTPAA